MAPKRPPVNDSPRPWLPRETPAVRTARESVQGTDGTLGGAANFLIPGSVTTPYSGPVDWSSMGYSPGENPPVSPSGGGGEPRDPNAGDGDNGWRPYGGGGSSGNALDQYQRNAIATVKGMLDQYGLSSLYGTIVDWIKEGYDANTVMVLIRSTPQYEQRFPAMKVLAAKGRAISEAEYINYEQTASGLERRYGLPTGMLMGKVTDLLTNEVSASELNDRVVLASAASIQAPQDLRDTFQQYYGIDQGGMTAYFLDPDVATPLLEKQYGSAVIGREAAAQGVGLDVYGAENLQNLGISKEQARQGFGEVAQQREFTTGMGDVLSEKEMISGTLAGDEAAQQKIERARQSRLGRFEGGGGFQAGQGQVALGSAATR